MPRKVGTAMSPVLDKIVHKSISEAREAVEREPTGFTPEQAEELFSWCLSAANTIDWSWDEFREAVKEGAEGRLLAGSLRAVLEQVDVVLSTYAKFRKIVTTSTPKYPGLPTSLSKLERAASAVEKKRQQFASMLAWLDTPLPSIDLAMLPKGEGPQSAQGYEDSKQILARLQSGGEL
jgi:hypothetical protein